MLVGVVAAGKAKGATTIAAGLGAAFGATGAKSLVIEADIQGGDLAYIRDLNVAKAGVLGFAAEMGLETPDAETAIGSHVWFNEKSPNCAVMPLTASGDAAPAQIAAMWSDGRKVLARWPGPVILDLGRWGDDLTKRIWAGCDIGVAICSGSVAGLRRAEATWSNPPLSNPFATWRIVNGSPWQEEQIETETGLAFEDVLEWDRRGAEHMRIGNWASAKRRHLGRQLTQLTLQIATDRKGVRS